MVHILVYRAELGAHIRVLHRVIECNTSASVAVVNFAVWVPQILSVVAIELIVLPGRGTRVGGVFAGC